MQSITATLATFQNQEIPHRPIQEAPAVDRAAGNGGGDKKVSGAPSIEIQGVLSLPWSRRAGCEGGAEGGEGAGRCFPYPPARAAVGEEDGAQGGLAVVQFADPISIFQKEWPRLE